MLTRTLPNAIRFLLLAAAASGCQPKSATVEQSSIASADSAQPPQSEPPQLEAVRPPHPADRLDAQPAAHDDYEPYPAEPPGVRTHVVQRGETLYAIAKRYYGDGRQWHRIYSANRNRLTDPRNVPVGIKLIIP